MIIAQEKRRENVVEYILYMFQIEDIIRGFHFDINVIEESIIERFQQSEKVKQDIKNWYANLIIMMTEENVTRRGHLKFLNELINELYELHSDLLKEPEETKYLECYNKAYLNISEFREKMHNDEMNEIEICLNALYALLLMRLKKQTVSEGTQKAMTTFSSLLAQLSFRYKQFESRN